jgi:hypothetical protein
LLTIISCCPCLAPQDDIQLLLPLAHKYAFEGVVHECLASLSASPGLFEQFSTQQDGPGYIITWLQLAADLQLDGVRATCARYLASERFFEQLNITPDSPGYILRWLEAATQLQLPELRAACMRYFTSDQRFLGQLNVLLEVPYSPGYVLTWLRAAEDFDVPELRATCLAFLRDAVSATASTDGGASEQDIEVSRFNSVSLGLYKVGKLARQEGMLALAPATLSKVLRATCSSFGEMMAQCQACHLDVWTAPEAAAYTGPCPHCKTAICYHNGSVLG